MRRLLIVLTLLLCTRTVRADIASSVYGDVRDVIEELIQTEVTTSVVRTVKERSPALGFYMRGTLERLGSPYWGSLGRVLKEDITVVVADFVYWHVSVGGGRHVPECSPHSPGHAASSSGSQFSIGASMMPSPQ